MDRTRMRKIHFFPQTTFDFLLPNLNIVLAVEGVYCAFALILLKGSWGSEAGRDETEPTEDAVALVFIQNYFI